MDSARALIVRIVEAGDGNVTLKSLSLGLGRNHAYLQQWIQRGKGGLPERERLKLARLLNVDEAELRSEPPPEIGDIRPVVDPPMPPTNILPAYDAPRIDARPLPRDIKVRGVAVAGETGAFSFNGDIVDYATRHPGISTLKSVEAIYVVDSSMWPLWNPGDLAYFTDVRQPKPGDHVIVELHADRRNENGAAFLKRFVGRHGSKIRLAQYNPPNDRIDIDADKVRVIHRVLEWRELLSGW